MRLDLLCLCRGGLISRARIWFWMYGRGIFADSTFGSLGLTGQTVGEVSTTQLPRKGSGLSSGVGNRGIVGDDVQ